MAKCPNLHIDSAIKRIKSVTFFCVPKPFHGQVGQIQQQAIASWMALNPRPTIVLFGDEPGTAEVAAAHDLIHVPDIQHNAWGTPLLDGVFAKAQRITEADVFVYVNADIVLLSDFLPAVYTVADQFERFLMVGRRWEVEVEVALSPTIHPGSPVWEQSLRDRIRTSGWLATPDAKDYFVFPRGLFADIPAFAVGRGYWDTWMVITALEQGYPVVDASLAIAAVHPEHDYGHVQGGKQTAYLGAEAQHNKILGKINRSGTIADATVQLKPGERKGCPAVSVLVLASPEHGRLSATVDSILAQPLPRSELEILLLDPGVANLWNQIPSHLQPSIRRHLIQGNVSTPDWSVRAFNEGLTHAKGEFLFMLSANHRLRPNALMQLLSMFDKYASTLDLILSGIHRINQGNHQHQIRTEPIDEMPWLDLPNLDNVHIWNLQNIAPPLARSAVVARRQRLDMIGGFNAHLSLPWAQVDAVVRLAFLRGSQVTWLKTVTQEMDSPHYPNQVIQDGGESRKLLDAFFTYPEVKPWMRSLKDKAYAGLDTTTR